MADATALEPATSSLEKRSTIVYCATWRFRGFRETAASGITASFGAAIPSRFSGKQQG